MTFLKNALHKNALHKYLFDIETFKYILLTFIEATLFVSVKIQSLVYITEIQNNEGDELTRGRVDQKIDELTSGRVNQGTS